jgi:hypothetical protein
VRVAVAVAVRHDGRRRRRPRRLLLADLVAAELRLAIAHHATDHTDDGERRRCAARAKARCRERRVDGGAAIAIVKLGCLLDYEPVKEEQSVVVGAPVRDGATARDPLAAAPEECK